MTRRSARTPIFTVPVDASGRWHFSKDQQRAFTLWLGSFAGKQVDVTAVEHEEARSLNANAYLWAEVYGKMEAANIGYTAQEFHELMLLKFATKKHYEIVNPRTGEVVEEYDVTERSSTMKGKRFYSIVEQIRQFLAEFYDVQTDDPDPAYWRKKEAA